jgi:hypothetical protein
VPFASHSFSSPVVADRTASSKRRRISSSVSPFLDHQSLACSCDHGMVGMGAEPKIDNALDIHACIDLSGLGWFHN